MCIYVAVVQIGRGREPPLRPSTGLRHQPAKPTSQWQVADSKMARIRIRNAATNPGPISCDKEGTKATEARPTCSLHLLHSAYSAHLGKLGSVYSRATAA